MHHHRCAGVFMQLAQAADVIDVRMRADDGFHREPVPAEQLQNAAHFIARIDNERLAGHRIADDRAVAWEHPHWNGDVQKALLFHTYCRNGFVHQRKYNIRFAAHHRCKTAATAPNSSFATLWMALTCAAYASPRNHKNTRHAARGAASASRGENARVVRLRSAR